MNPRQFEFQVSAAPTKTTTQQAREAAQAPMRAAFRA